MILNSEFSTRKKNFFLAFGVSIFVVGILVFERVGGIGFCL